MTACVYVLTSNDHSIHVLPSLLQGTILDLPYIFKADGEQTEMTASADFDMQPLLQLAAALASGASLTEALSSQDPQQLMSIAQQCCTIL